MMLRDTFIKQGDWLFRWRSYLPLILVFIVLLGMRQFEYLGDSENYDDIWEVFCLIISLLGIGIRFLTVGFVPKGTSGTNTRCQIADSLNTLGMYSIVRHPLYLGNFVIWFGLSAFFHLWWFSLIVVLIFWLYYERIMIAEEEFLNQKFGESYLQWSAVTPAFIPDLRNWRSPCMAFSFRKAIKNEYKSVFAVIVSFTLLEIIGDLFVEHQLEIDIMWLSIFTTGLTTYIVIRLLKKTTNLLEE
uniref:DUF1295 domain-containing protein n=1 Tax=Desulfatirhabdium butyrativorans TaxID=340467 RepID=A0A7C4RUG3_9BACT